MNIQWILNLKTKFILGEDLNRYIIELFHQMIDGLIHGSWDPDVLHVPSWSKAIINFISIFCTLLTKKKSIVQFAIVTAM